MDNRPNRTASRRSNSRAQSISRFTSSRLPARHLRGSRGRVVNAAVAFIELRILIATCSDRPQSPRPRQCRTVCQRLRVRQFVRTRSTGTRRREFYAAEEIADYLGLGEQLRQRAVMGGEKERAELAYGRSHLALL